MNITRIIFLDTSVLARLSSQPSLMSKITDYFIDNNLALVLGTMTLVELYRRPSGWGDIADFLSTVPFCIARNPDGILDVEVKAYPNETKLPVNFCASANQFSKGELRQILDVNMKDKIAQFDSAFRPLKNPVWNDMIKNRNKATPDNGVQYSNQERANFLKTSVEDMLIHLSHKAFLNERLSRGETIDVTCFKSVYIQALAVFLEYYIQKKKGKSSDVADFYQLGYVPYVDLAVLDNERTDLIRRINRTGLFAKNLQVQNWGEFKNTIIA